MRGVHAWGRLWNGTTLGSSPHARGPPEKPVELLKNLRIIPACAGSTRETRGAAEKSQDHPRMRGVHPIISTLDNPTLGSSPHARGPPFRLSSNRLHTRIIPACAGSTRFLLLP